MKKHRTAEIIIGASIIAGLALFFIIGAMSGDAGGDMAAWVNYYGHSLIGSATGFFYYTILFICLLVIMLVVWSLGGAFLEILFPKWRLGRKKLRPEDPREIFIAAARRSREMLLIIPAILFITVAALVMGEANMFAPAHLQDTAIIGIEHAILGTYVFAALGAIHYPHWLIVFIIFCFENMAAFLIGAGILLAYIARERFREMLVAFCIGILAMIPLWLMVPALSPQDRFIDNVYHLSMPAPIAAAVASYHPQPEIATFLQTIRTGKAGLPALPTSTIPSAHIFWATIVGFYLFRASYDRAKHARNDRRRRAWRCLGWVALPFILASSLGTVLLAQHYFLDVPAGLAVAALAIWLAHEIEPMETTSVASREKFDAPHEVADR